MRIESIDRRDRAPGWEAYENYKLSLQNSKNGKGLQDLVAEGGQESALTKAVNPKDEAGSSKGCTTCKERKYQDGSDDPGVSFKTPTKLSPDQAASAVRSHEMEHVGREQFQASQEGREVVSQFVRYHNSICPECGRAYISGGTTTTTTRGKAAYTSATQNNEKQLEVFA